MEQPKYQPILLKCMAPKPISALGFKATDFVRRKQGSMFCHIRFTRQMREEDNLELKVIFHDVPLADGQCLLSITPPEFRNKKAKDIVEKNPYIIDPTTSWISYLKDEDSRRIMRFGIMHKNGSIHLRLPGDTEFFSFYHIPQDNDDICIDIFFCEYVKSVGLRDPSFPANLENGALNDHLPLLYQERTQVVVP